MEKLMASKMKCSWKKIPRFASSLLLAGVLWLVAPEVKAWDFLPQGYPEFSSAMKSGRLDQAKAIIESDALLIDTLKSTPAGMATLSLIYFNTGAPVTAVEFLFTIQTPDSLPESLKSQLKRAISPTSTVWDIARIHWTPRWADIFPATVDSSHPSRASFSVNSQDDLRRALRVLQASKLRLSQKQELSFQIALYEAQSGQLSAANRRLEKLLEAKPLALSPDPLYLTLARIAYEKGDLNKAIEFDKKISKASDFWIEAKEEAAWAMVRQGRYDSALGEMKTVLSPVLAPVARADAYFLQAFSHLQICDYNSVYKVISRFKTESREKILSLEKISQGIATPAQAQLLNTSSRTGQAILLPRQILLDKPLSQALSHRQALLQENQGSGNLFAVKEAVKADEIRIQQRLQRLAEAEIKTFRLVVAQFNALEAETIQRIHVDQELVKDLRKKNLKYKASKNSLVFPDDGEIWLDELDAYQAQVKDCPSRERKFL